MFRQSLSSPAWWAAFAAFVGSAMTVRYGAALGQAAQSAVVGAGALVVATYVAGHHANERAKTHAAAVVSVAKVNANPAALASGADRAKLAAAPQIPAG